MNIAFFISILERVCCNYVIVFFLLNHSPPSHILTRDSYRRILFLFFLVFFIQKYEGLLGIAAKIRI